MGPLGVQEMLAIFIIALLLFGPKKLPELGRMLGKAVREFRRAKNELKSTFESHLSELEREIDVDKQLTGTGYSGVSYPHPYDEQGPHSSYNTSSVSYPTYEAHENGASETYTTDVPEKHEPGSNGEVSERTPVAGTVPRSNGVQRPSLETTEEERSA